jgi:hypothetical protein
MCPHLQALEAELKALIKETREANGLPLLVRQRSNEAEK